MCPTHRVEDEDQDEVRNAVIIWCVNCQFICLLLFVHWLRSYNNLWLNLYLCRMTKRTPSMGRTTVTIAMKRWPGAPLSRVKWSGRRRIWLIKIGTLVRTRYMYCIANATFEPDFIIVIHLVIVANRLSQGVCQLGQCVPLDLLRRSI